MKKPFLTIIFSIFIFIPATTSPVQNISVNLSSMSYKMISPGRYTINFSIHYENLNREILSGLKVPISIEKFLIYGHFPDFKLRENNFLFSEMNFDLNGNGNYSDIYSIKVISKNLSLDNTQIKYFSSSKKFNQFTVFNYYDDKDKLNINKISENGPEFFIHTISYSARSLTAGFGTADEPVKIEEFPNPNVQVLVLSPVKSTSSKIVHSIDGEPIIIHFQMKKYSGRMMMSGMELRG